MSAAIAEDRLQQWIDGKWKYKKHVSGQHIVAQKGKIPSFFSLWDNLSFSFNSFSLQVLLLLNRLWDEYIWRVTSYTEWPQNSKVHRNSHSWIKHDVQITITTNEWPKYINSTMFLHITFIIWPFKATQGSRSDKVIGHGAKWKPTYKFVLVDYTNYMTVYLEGHISYDVIRDSQSLTSRGQSIELILTSFDRLSKGYKDNI